MKVQCIETFTQDDLPYHLRDIVVTLPKAGEIYHVVSAQHDGGRGHCKAGLYYTLQEVDARTWYHADRFRRVTDISALQALSVIKTKTKVLEEV